MSKYFAQRLLPIHLLSFITGILNQNIRNSWLGRLFYVWFVNKIYAIQLIKRKPSFIIDRRTAPLTYLQPNRDYAFIRVLFSDSFVRLNISMEVTGRFLNSFCKCFNYSSNLSKLSPPKTDFNLQFLVRFPKLTGVMQLDNSLLAWCGFIAHTEWACDDRTVGKRPNFVCSFCKRSKLDLTLRITHPPLP